MVYGFIKQVALGRADFTDSPVIVTDIILCCKLPIFVCGIGVNQFLALIDAVNRTCQSGVALRISCFCIGLCDSHIEFL